MIPIPDFHPFPDGTPESGHKRRIIRQIHGPDVGRLGLTHRDVQRIPGTSMGIQPAVESGDQILLGGRFRMVRDGDPSAPARQFYPDISPDGAPIHVQDQPGGIRQPGRRLFRSRLPDHPVIQPVFPAGEIGQVIAGRSSAILDTTPLPTKSASPQPFCNRPSSM